MTTRDEIQQILKRSPGAPDVLDALVHDCADEIAASINNDGLDAQLAFLRGQGRDEAGVLQYLQEGAE
jgi:hypothetical protein